MINIVVVSHGKLCSALVSSAKIITGRVQRVYSVPLLAKDSPSIYEEKLNAVIQDEHDVEEFIRRLKKYTDVQELTREMCLELIEYITIDAYQDEKPRDIHIYYKLLEKPLENKRYLDIPKSKETA